MALVAALAGAAAWAADWQWSLQSDRHADALALRELGHDDAARRLQPRTGRNFAYVDDEARASLHRGEWTYSLLARSSASLVANHDALALAGTLARRQIPAASIGWNVDARFRAFSGAGVELARRIELAPGWQATVSVQALRLSHWRERDLQGAASFDAADATFGFALQSQRGDDRLRVPFQQPVPAQGVGLLFGASSAWRGEHAGLAVALRDVGALHWSAWPREQSALDTDTRAVDADGFVVYRPLLQGRSSQGGATRAWRGRLQVQASWILNQDHALNLSGRMLPDYGWLPSLGWRGHLGDATAGLEWLVHERRLDVSLRWHGWSIVAGADRLGGARSRRLALSWRPAG